MNREQALDILCAFQKWRRYDGPIGEGPIMPCPKEIGQALDIAIDIMRGKEQMMDFVNNKHRDVDMSKYIDADRLKAEINNRKKSLRAGICGEAFTRKQKNEMLVASEELDRFNRIIDSLQQEQPKEICHKCIHYGKDDDYCYYQHGGMQRLIKWCL